MASKKSSKKKSTKKSTTPQESNVHLFPNDNNKYLAMYPRTIRITHDVGSKGRMSLNKPVPNVVWKEFQKSQKEKAARAKALSILKKKKKKRSEAKNRKKEQLFVCNVMHI